MVEKPWALFGISGGAIGKIIEENVNSVFLQYYESQMYPPELWDSKYVKKFKTPVELIEYFWKNNPDSEQYPNKKSIVNKFLYDFPSERKNLEKYFYSN